VLTHLSRGHLYTVLFSVKPLAPVVTSGGVGDLSGKGWPAQAWTAAPIVRWQRFRKFLRATSETESLVIYDGTGASRVLVDGLEVLRGRYNGPSGDFKLQPAVARPNFIADDVESAAMGGTLSSTAWSGKFSRQLRSRQSLAIRSLAGLRPGTGYTVVAWVRPLHHQAASGTIGGGGSGWSAAPWHVRGIDRWQPIVARLTAVRTTDRVAVTADHKSAPFLVDGLRVLRSSIGIARAAAAPSPASPTVIQAPRQRLRKVEGSASPAQSGTLAAAVRNTFDTRSATGENANTRWRLAYWRELLRRTAHHPVFGVGFGVPARFHWSGILYDARVGNPRDPNDLTPPHNSFVNLLYRGGLAAFLPCVALIGIALLRVLRGVQAADAEARVRIATFAGVFVFSFVIANLNVALEGPYMGIFFWTTLALLLVAPQLDRSEGGAR
jgi:O-Antigen ligase